MHSFLSHFYFFYWCLALFPFTIINVVGIKLINNRLSTIYNDKKGGNNDKVSPEYWFNDQILDHFDESNKNTWQQRYFMNGDWYKSGGPIFLCVGGESTPLTGHSVYHSIHCNDAVELLPKVNGMMFALEHRFYGTSNPTKDFSTSNLKLLTSRQALADLNGFVNFANTFYNLTGSKWITFGGSYPGMLSAWARYLYPSTIYASISSSAPVEAIVDFTGYFDIVASSIKNPLVGGSQQCLDVVTEGHQKIAQLLNSKTGRSYLLSKFNICGGEESLDVLRNRQVFAGDGVVSFPFQENDPACSEKLCNIKKLCNFLTNEAEGTFFSRILQLHKKQNGDACVNIDFNATIMKSTLDISLAGGQDRIWIWQTCNEFGYYQTCEKNTNCPWARNFDPLEQHFEICQRAFGVTEKMIRKNVKKTNDFYGGFSLKEKTSRTLFIQGGVDPWSAQGIVDIFVPSSSHHFWTHPSKPTDDPTIIATRQKIWNQIIEWIS